jgi:hypothetical protein
VIGAWTAREYDVMEMRKLFPIMAVIVFAPLIVAATASAQGKTKVACAKSVLPPVKVVGQVRPDSCVLYGRRGIAFVRGINWKGWGHRRAHGKGEWCTARVCAPARVKLRRPKRGYFSKARLSATGSPLEGDSAEIRLITRPIG